MRHRLASITPLLLALALAASCRPAAPSAASPARATSTAAPGRSFAGAPDRYLDLGEVRLRYREAGAGTPVLLLHGYTDRLEMWIGPADSLAAAHRVIVPDLRGFGKSTVPPVRGRYGLAMLDDVVGLLDRLDVPRVHVVGYSMGGMLAAQMALRHPARVASATFVAGAFWEDSAATAHELDPLIDAIPTKAGLLPFFRWIMPTWSDSSLRPIVAQLTAENDRRALVDVPRSFGTLALDWGLVRASGIPVTALVGTADPLVPHARRIASRWPGAVYVEVPDGDHADVSVLPPTLAAIRLAIARGEGR